MEGTQELTKRRPPLKLKVPSAFYRMLRRVSSDNGLSPEACLMRALHLFDDFATRRDLKAFVEDRQMRAKKAREWWAQLSASEKTARAQHANKARWKK